MLALIGKWAYTRRILYAKPYVTPLNIFYSSTVKQSQKDAIQGMACLAMTQAVSLKLLAKLLRNLNLIEDHQGVAMTK